jgi:uncharacterized metal-binding protein YceD (DUF177 family)
MLEFDLSPLIGIRPGERLVFSLDEGPQLLEDVFAEFLRGTLQFTRIEGGILVAGSMDSRLKVECVRCLEPFSFDATLELEEIIGLSGRPGPDIVYQITDEGWFNAIPLLREAAWVTVPIKPLCQPSCRGLCSDCGTNLNLEECDCQRDRVNPHFALLASFLTQRQE